MKLIKIIHPLLDHKFSYLRDEKTSSKDFRENLKEIAIIMSVYALKDINTKDLKIKTPLGITEGKRIYQNLNIFPIMRAGLGMLEGFVGMIPNNYKICHIGMKRNEKTLEPEQYLFKSSSDENDKENLNIILEPIIATGGSIIKAVESIRSRGYKNKIKIISILSTKDAIEKIEKVLDNVELYLIEIDKSLSKNGFIQPGIGDAGDRIFNTK